MRRQVNLLIILIILNVFSYMYISNNKRVVNAIPTSYRCTSLFIDNNIHQKIVELNDEFKITYETYYTYNMDNSIFNRIFNSNKNFYNLITNNYIISGHEYAYKDKDMTISKYISVNPKYICSVNSYKVKED